MIKYFFHIRDHGQLIPDDEGLYLSGLEAAAAEAWLSAGDLAAAAIRIGTGVSCQSIEYSDEHGNILGSTDTRTTLH
jgi:hypothetical protein